MQYREFSPPISLAPYINCFWILEGAGNGQNTSRERIIPDGCPELIFHFGAQYCRFGPDGSEQLQPRSFIYGQIRDYIEIGPTGDSGILAVRFHPHGLAPFLDMPVRELNGLSVSLEELFGREGTEIEERLMSATGTTARIELISRFLLDLLNKVRRSVGDDPLIADAVTTLRRKRGDQGIEDLAGQYGLSRRQFDRRFTASVGLNPKVLARILRFQQAFSLSKDTRIDSLTDLALACGYYDQAHFIRDFRAFSGINPSSWFRRDHKMQDFFSGGC